MAPVFSETGTCTGKRCRARRSDFFSTIRFPTLGVRIGAFYSKPGCAQVGKPSRREAVARPAPWLLICTICWSDREGKASSPAADGGARDLHSPLIAHVPVVPTPGHGGRGNSRVNPERGGEPGLLDLRFRSGGAWSLRSGQRARK